MTNNKKYYHNDYVSNDIIVDGVTYPSISHYLTCYAIATTHTLQDQEKQFLIDSLLDDDDSKKLTVVWKNFSGKIKYPDITTAMKVLDPVLREKFTKDEEALQELKNFVVGQYTIRIDRPTSSVESYMPTYLENLQKELIDHE